MTKQPTAQQVTARFQKTAMAVILRNVANHNWGWFSREDQRMHLQTVEDGSRTGPNRAKVWLENKGKRIIEVAEGSISGADLKLLKTKITLEQKRIEDEWVMFMTHNDWLKVDLAGSIVTLTAYPRSHNKFTRTLDLRNEFPGAYELSPSWADKLIYVSIQEDMCALAVGPTKNTDDRNHFYLPKILWID